jgi:hypothetical protein
MYFWTSSLRVQSARCSALWKKTLAANVRLKNTPAANVRLINTSAANVRPFCHLLVCILVRVCLLKVQRG